MFAQWHSDVGFDLLIRSACAVNGEIDICCALNVSVVLFCTPGCTKYSLSGSMGYCDAIFVSSSSEWCGFGKRNIRHYNLFITHDKINVKTKWAHFYYSVGFSNAGLLLNGLNRKHIREILIKMSLSKAMHLGISSENGVHCAWALMC